MEAWNESNYTFTIFNEQDCFSNVFEIRPCIH
jgi:hypothetical protein